MKGISQEQLADNLNITRSRIGSYEESRSEPNIETLICLADFFKLPVDALVRTDLSKLGDKPYMDIGKHRILFPIQVDAHNQDVIEVIPAKASAGYLNGYADPEYIEQLPVMQLPFLRHGKFRAFPIQGDSMPPLQRGSFVIGRFVENYAAMEDGKTYVLLTRTEGIVYKRIYRAAKSRRKLVLKSDNPVYAPYTIDLDDVLEVWEFKSSVHTQANVPEEVSSGQILEMLKQMRDEIQELQKRSRR